MKFSLIALCALLSLNTLASEICVSGKKGTATQNYTFKVSQFDSGERTLSLYDANKALVVSSKASNQFTKFNSNGYGVCSIAGVETEDASGSKYKIELKITPHSVKECNQVSLPTSIEYLTLKINPRGTTLGDDITAYALSMTPCP